MPRSEGGVRLAAEVAGVIFAVLVALAVDEYWEGRENAELGREADARIVEEIRDNRTEVREALESNRVLLEGVREAVGQDSIPQDFNFQYELAVLSTSAWEAAGLTGAIRFLDFDRVSSYSRLYNVQGFYEERQRRVVEEMGILFSITRDEMILPAFQEVMGPLAVATALEESLLSSYDSVLVELGAEPGGAEAETADEPETSGGS